MRPGFMNRMFAACSRRRFVDSDIRRPRRDSPRRLQRVPVGARITDVTQIGYERTIERFDKFVIHFGGAVMCTSPYVCARVPVIRESRDGPLRGEAL